jgi:Caudovirus prohead serine protease
MQFDMQAARISLLARSQHPDPILLRGKAGHRTRFEGIAYSGGIMGGGHNAVVDLTGTSAKAGMPLLLNHDHDRYIGAVTSCNITANAITVVGELFDDVEEDARKIVEKLRAGAPFQLSIGLYDAKIMESRPGGETINGKKVAEGIKIYRRGTIREVSVVPLGADAETSIMLARARTKVPATAGELLIAGARKMAAEFHQQATNQRK